MTYREFKDNSELSKAPATFCLTLEDDTAIILQWESSNEKWYKLKPFWGREEIGCYNMVENKRIVHIREI